MKLVNLVPLEELDINDPALMKYRASRTADKSDSPISKPSKPTRDLTYAKKLKLDMLKAKRDQLMRDMEQEAEPEGGPIADRYGAQLNKIDAAMAKLRGTKDMTYNQAIGLRETTEKAWNAIDVSRKAEKEISNKEWNERTSKKLDMLKKLNDAGKFKKDWDEETLQGWVDQNFSWEKVSKKFKLNEMQETSDYDMLRSFQKDELLDDLGDIIAKYVKDPDDIDRELDRFDDGGFDNMSNMVTANLLRDPEYKAWAKKFHSIKENNNMRKVIRKIIREQNFDDRLRSMMGADDFEKATNPKLAKLINNAIMTVDPEMSYVDFAKGVAQVLIDEYGVQNYEPFISELKKALDSTLG